MVHSGFFNKTPASPGKKQETVYRYIPVGHKQFQAVAVALMDNFKNVARVNEAGLKKILERFFVHFPKFVSLQPYLTASERMQMLISSSRKSEIVDCIAYTLRQLAIDEIYANPASYYDVIEAFDPSTAQDKLRLPSTALHVSAFRALTQSLGITIILSLTQPGKELRQRICYQNDAVSAPKFEVTIKLHGKKYFSRVHKDNQADFTYVGHLASSTAKPVELPSDPQDTLESLYQVIAADHSILRELFEQHYNRLIGMVEKGELTKGQLLSLYGAFIPVNNTLTSSEADFFNQLISEGNTSQGIDHEMSLEQHLQHGMVSKLSGWMSTNQVDPDKLFDRLDEKTAFKGHSTSAA